MSSALIGDNISVGASTSTLDMLAAAADKANQTSPDDACPDFVAFPDKPDFIGQASENIEAVILQQLHCIQEQITKQGSVNDRDICKWTLRGIFYIIGKLQIQNSEYQSDNDRLVEINRNLRARQVKSEETIALQLDTIKTQDSEIKRLTHLTNFHPTPVADDDSQAKKRKRAHDTQSMPTGTAEEC